MSDDDDEEWLKTFLEEEERLLTKGDDLQKLSVIGSLPELLKYDQKGTVSKIIPKIQQELPKSSSEFNLAVSRMFNILMHMDIPVNLVPQVLQGIENREPIIANAWMETLLSVIPLLKEQVLKNDILKCAVSKSQLSKAAYFRVLSCKILGQISIHRTMNPFEVKRDVLPLVQSLCQDCLYEVRAAMCKELSCVAKGLYNLGDAIVKVNLLPLLVELSADENISVRCIAIESMVAIIPFLSADTIKSTIIPLAKKLCTKSACEGDTTYTAISNVFSTLIGNLQFQMSSSDAMWFLDYYNHICKKGLPLMENIDSSVCMLCRENCASSLPKVAAMVLALIPNEISFKWYHTFKILATDPCYTVRKSVAICFCDMVRILGPTNEIMVLDFTKLLRDEDEDVLQALVPNISHILELFSNSNVLQREVAVQATLDIGQAMLKCQSEVFRTNNWRMKESLLMQWECLPNCFPSDFIHQHFSPVVLTAAIHGGAKPVRSQATRTILIFLKYNLKENHRKWIREMILTQLCNAPCCYARQVFVILCGHAIEIFSWKYFKEYFYVPLLNLAEDQIAVVRLCVVKLFPMLKQMLVLPNDEALQFKLENILLKMEKTETDKDVIMMLKIKLKEMGAFGSIKNNVLMEDKRKAEDEERILKERMGVVIAGQSCTLEQKDAEAMKNFDEKQIPVSLTKSVISKLSTFSTGSKRSAGYNSSLGLGSSPMPFLDQHFYIDAGVALPQDFGVAFPDKDVKSPLKTSLEVKKLINSAENLTTWLDQVSVHDEVPKIQLQESDMVISVENVKLTENLTESDVKALKTATSNMTDDLKVNIQSVFTEELKGRQVNKRNSCIFTNEMRANVNSSIKRRSLNIAIESKIPVCSRIRSISQQGKSKSFGDQSLDSQRFARFTRSNTSLNQNNNISKISSGNKIIHLRRSSSTDKMVGNNKLKFKRFSASEKIFEDSLKNNNAQGQEGCSDLSAKNMGSKASGLPLSIRSRKQPPK
ncbi:serine/threonine-protein phosphatase 4 regulatory subunit 4-like [Euwallacea fornicatus]|uniref:serine/threonine-protein phosphatase 4 regulatory subunit 4-like n=1 Tax=Euwallacea fornicatus TaxID=995702 RepID=UPI0033902227